MASQLQPVSSTGEEEDAFTMEFSFDIETDFLEIVEHMAYRSTLGQFRAAREISDSLLEEPIDIFPVAFEAIRLLYDQGQYSQLRKTVQKITKGHQRWDAQELNILKLMDKLAATAMDGSTDYDILSELESYRVAEMRLGRLRSGRDDERVSLHQTVTCVFES